MRTELSECHARSEADSLHRQRLTITIAELQQAVELYRSSHTYNEQAIAELQGLIRFYKKQIRGIKAKGWIGGTFGGIAAFGAGVGTAFIIIKTL